jgi:hypothetical protein
VNLYYLIDDLECERLYGDKSPRPFVRQGLPSTIPIFRNTKSRTRNKGRVALSSKWMRYAKLINSTPTMEGYNFQFTKKGLFQHAVGWHNVGKGNIVEQLTFSGNIVDVYRIENEKAFIRCFYNNETPPKELIRCEPGHLNPLVHLLTTQYWNKLDITTDGHCPQTFIIATSRKQELWIDVKNIRRL